MAFDPTSDRWNEPCDLCGNVSYESIALREGARVLRCRECGLVTLVRDQQPGTANGSGGTAETGNLSLPRVLEQARDEQARSVLVIGIDRLPKGIDFASFGSNITFLVDPGITLDAGRSVTVYDMSLERAPFLPEQFDLIVCARSIESFDSPALLFEKTRLWLATGGTLLISGMNRGSLPARLWRDNWMRAHAAGAQHLLDTDNLRGYADRFGYEVKRLRMYSSLRDVTRAAGRESSLLETLLAPIALTANLLNMGDTFLATLVKGGAAVRPMPRRAVDKEEDRAPGLAPAMYSGVRREGK
jgi:SAM-dependent methyltransferase